MTNARPPLGLPPSLTGATRLFAILGDPIDQAGSPGLFNRSFRERRIPAVLVPMHVGTGDLLKVLAAFRATQNWDGLIVTVPHKVAIADHLDELGIAASRLGAVNAIRKDGDRLLGDNFDGLGFLNGLVQAGHRVTGLSVLMIGAGGAGRAVGHALADSGASKISIADTDFGRARQLAQSLRSDHVDLEVEVCSQPAAAGFDVVVNCAPVEGSIPPICMQGAVPHLLVVDIALKPSITPLIASAQAMGFATHSGIHMLEGQVDEILRFFGLTKT